MSSVLSLMECPQCGNPDGWYEYCTRRGDETLFCSLCGLDHSLRMVVDPEKSTPQMAYPKLDQDGHWIYKCSKRRGFGIIAFGLVAGGTHVHRFARTPSARQIQREIERIQTNTCIDPLRSYVTRWDAVLGQVVVEFGEVTLPVKAEHSPEPGYDTEEIPDVPDDDAGEIFDEPDDDDFVLSPGEIRF